LSAADAAGPFRGDPGVWFNYSVMPIATAAITTTVYRATAFGIFGEYFPTKAEALAYLCGLLANAGKVEFGHPAYRGGRLNCSPEFEPEFQEWEVADSTTTAATAEINPALYAIIAKEGRDFDLRIGADVAGHPGHGAGISAGLFVSVEEARRFAHRRGIRADRIHAA